MAEYVQCDHCLKEYSINFTHFDSDPDGILCNSCYDKFDTPEDLGINVGEDIKTGDHVR